MRVPSKAGAIRIGPPVGAGGPTLAVAGRVGCVSGPRALWSVAAGAAALAPAAEGSGVLLQSRWSGISRGTERLVHQGAVPESERQRMRAPHQEGDFPFPVKYGYATVAEIAEGPEAGRMVFALFPHQDRFRLPRAALIDIPDGVPPARAVLAANMETALNTLWDAGILPGDRVAVIGAGVVGALLAWLAACVPGTEVTLSDLNPDRAALAQALGCSFAPPDALESVCDVVINASASGAGLVRALEIAGPEASVIEASWHGATPVSLPLGGAFHSRRLRIVSSQVGTIPPARAPRWDHQRRLAKALDLLRDDRLDRLITGETDFDDIAGVYSAILASPDTLCHRIRHD